jgi:8-oxo-dGTP diphosphatase
MIRMDSRSPLLRGTILVDAPARTVAAALAEPWLLGQAIGRRVDAPAAQFTEGDRVTVGPVRLRVTQADEHGVELAGVGHRLRLAATVVPTGAGTLVTYGIGWLPVGLVLVRQPILRLVRTMLTAVRDRAEQLAATRIVVGAAIVADGTVLAAQRDRPLPTAGRWEFPGGKVEPGETEQAALARECREELAVDVLVGDRIGPDLVLPSGWLLRLHLAELAGDGQPVAGEHRALRWVPADRLAELDWLPADRVVLPGLAGWLSRDRPAAAPPPAGVGPVPAPEPHRQP